MSNTCIIISFSWAWVLHSSYSLLNFFSHYGICLFFPGNPYFCSWATLGVQILLEPCWKCGVRARRGRKLQCWIWNPWLSEGPSMSKVCSVWWLGSSIDDNEFIYISSISLCLSFSLLSLFFYLFIYLREHYTHFCSPVVSITIVGSMRPGVLDPSGMNSWTWYHYLADGTVCSFTNP